MSNSYRTLIERLRLFANGHFLIKGFFHGQLDAADIEKEPNYPMMHVLPVQITPSAGYLDYELEIRFADIGRDKELKTDYQKEIISDCSRLALDLVSEIENGQVIFGGEAEVLNQTASIQPFMEEFTHVLTGVVLNVTIRLPYNWSACDIPADYSPLVIDNPSIGGGLLTKIAVWNDGVFVGYASALDFSDDFSVTFVGGKAIIDYIGAGGGLTCEDLPTCQTIIDIEANIDAIESDVTALEGEVETIKENISNLDGRVSQVEGDISTLQSDVSALQSDVSNLQNDVTDLQNDKVPYTGATANVDLGTFGIKTTEFVDFNTAPTNTPQEARMIWNDVDGTMDLGLKGGNVTLQIGQENIVRVVNKTNGTLNEADYQVVRFRTVAEGGAQGQRMAVRLAQANNDLNSATTIGVVTETIANNQEGFICTSGHVRGINTTGSLQGETWVDGDVLYLSPTSAGKLTNIKPVAPDHMVIVGYVEYAHATQGKIFVKVDNGYELDELHNVLITNTINKQWLEYDGSVWKNTGTFNYSINFKDVEQHSIILPYNWRIVSIGSNPSALSVTIEKNGSAYTLDTNINANTDEITLDVNAVGFINLICRIV